MGALSPTHWLIAICALVLLFGANKLPDAARSLGRSARILKAEVKDMGGDGKSGETDRPTQAIATAAVARPGAASDDAHATPDSSGVAASGIGSDAAR